MFFNLALFSTKKHNRLLARNTSIITNYSDIQITVFYAAIWNEAHFSPKTKLTV